MFGLCLIAGFIVSVLISFPLVMVAFFLVMGFAVVSVVNFKQSVLIYILLRSALDIFSRFLLIPGIASANLSGVVTVIFLMMSTVEFFKRKQNPFKLPFLRSYLYFLSISVFSVIFSTSPWGCVGDWLRFLGLFNLAASIYFVFEPRDIVKVVYVIGLSTLLPAILSLASFFIGNQVHDAGFARVYGSFVHPNMYAFFLMTVLFLYIPDLIFGKGVIHRSFALLIGVVSIILLVLTFTRAAWVGFFIGSVIILWRKKSAPFFLGFLLLGVCLLPFLWPRFHDVGLGNVGGYRLDSWTWRLNTWTESLQDFQWSKIFGIGLGGYYALYGFYAHNDYLRLLVETGILGVLAYIAIFIVFFQRACFIFRSTDEVLIKNIAFSVILTTVAYLIIGVSDNISRAVSILTYYFVMVALMEMGVAKRKVVTG